MCLGRPIVYCGQSSTYHVHRLEAELHGNSGRQAIVDSRAHNQLLGVFQHAAQLRCGWNNIERDVGLLASPVDLVEAILLNGDCNSHDDN